MDTNLAYMKVQNWDVLSGHSWGENLENKMQVFDCVTLSSNLFFSISAMRI